MSTGTVAPWPAIPPAQPSIVAVMPSGEIAYVPASAVGLTLSETITPTPAPTPTPTPVPALKVVVTTIDHDTIQVDFGAADGKSEVTDAVVWRAGTDRNGTGAWETRPGAKSPFRFELLEDGTAYKAGVRARIGGVVVTGEGIATTDKDPVPGTTPGAGTQPGTGGSSPSNPATGTWLSGASGMGVEGQAAADGEFARWRGSRLAVAATWADSGDSNQRNAPALAQRFGNWQASIDVAVGALVPGETWAEAKKGRYDDRWVSGLKALAAWWKARKDPAGSTVFIRFAHEMNGNWYPWTVTAANYADFMAAWKRYRALQQQHFPQAKLVFNLNRESVKTGIDWRRFFPGREHVDVMGVDYYNQYPWANDERGWNAALNQTDAWGAPKGIGSHLAHARSVGLPLGLAEWSDNGSMGDGDDWGRRMHALYKTSGGWGPGQIAYEILFNHKKEHGGWHVTGDGVQHPKFARVYQDLF
ncbi:glycosyl hydrolase [Kineococcus gynurae]|uniref:Glycosyl hydrolase n=1 Tax=Kineococcus gynurae TaxID=452979 RepID=A0ABV5LWZ4_9ACTN